MNVKEMINTAIVSSSYQQCKDIINKIASMDEPTLKYHFSTHILWRQEYSQTAIDDLYKTIISRKKETCRRNTFIIFKKIWSNQNYCLCMSCSIYIIHQILSYYWSPQKKLFSCNCVKLFSKWRNRSMYLSNNVVYFLKLYQSPDIVIILYFVQ